jgi:dTMP kinase
VTEGKRIICVSGIDGSGKTTLLGRLAENLPETRTVTIWDIMKFPEPGAKIAFRDKKEVDDYLQKMGHPERAIFLFECLTTAMNRALKAPEKTLLIDAYWYKYYSTELAMHGESARKELDAAIRDFPAVDTLFFIAFNANSALARKKSFSGYESGYAPERTPESFVAFQSLAYENLKPLMKDAGAIVLDGETPVETKLAVCLRELDRT